MNKKASARDIIFIGVVLFATGLIFFVMNFSVNTTVPLLLNETSINQSQEIEDSFNASVNTANRLDYVFFAVFIGLTLALVITGWLIPTHPIWAIIYFFFVVLSVVISSILEYVWEAITPASVFGTTISNFPITNFIIGNLPVFMTIIGTIGLVVMFAKPYIGQGY